MWEQLLTSPFFWLALLISLIGAFYLVTIGRVTDVIPIIGLADDAVIILVIVSAWVIALVDLVVKSTTFWIVLVLVVLYLMFRAGKLGGRKR